MKLFRVVEGLTPFRSPKASTVTNHLAEVRYRTMVKYPRSIVANIMGLLIVQNDQAFTSKNRMSSWRTCWRPELNWTTALLITMSFSPRLMRWMQTSIVRSVNLMSYLYHTMYNEMMTTTKSASFWTVHRSSRRRMRELKVRPCYFRDSNGRVSRVAWNPWPHDVSNRKSALLVESAPELFIAERSMTRSDNNNKHAFTNLVQKPEGLSMGKNSGYDDSENFPLNFLGEPARQILYEKREIGSVDAVYKLTRPKIITV